MRKKGGRDHPQAGGIKTSKEDDHPRTVVMRKQKNVPRGWLQKTEGEQAL